MKRVNSGALSKNRQLGLDSINGLCPVIESGPDMFAYTKLRNGVQFRVNGVVKNVLFYGPRTVRINANLGTNHWKFPSIVVVRGPDAVPFRVFESETTLTVSSKRLRVVVDKNSGAVAFYDAEGRLHTQERPDQPQTVKEVQISDAPTYEVSNTFILKPDEAIYGFGYTGADGINRRGKNLLLVQTNTRIALPMMVSTEHYGIMWDIYSKMTFRDSAEGATLWAESAPGGVDYYFFGGDNMDEVIAAYRDLTGAAPMFPKQAFGLFMSKERYDTQDEVLLAAHKFREAFFPLDYIVQDWHYWGDEDWWSSMTWDPYRYPDPAKLTRDLHNMHIKLMISVWPTIGNASELACELDNDHLRFAYEHFLFRHTRIYDAYSEKARQIYFKHAKQGLFGKGVDALWLDATEVEVGPSCWNWVESERDIKRLGQNAMGDFTRYLNPYSLMATKGIYDGCRSIGDKRVFTLSRSAWAGSQRTAAASWSGDTTSGWGIFRTQIDAGLSIVMSGIPYWSQDIGGFFVTSSKFPGGEHNRAFRELFTRWYQFGVFNPIMRIHGADVAREPYLFKTIDTQVYDALLMATRLRYRLLPYIYSLAWQITNSGYTLMRPMPMDFPDDFRVRDSVDSFMFGSAFLVHPVTRPICPEITPPMPPIPLEVLSTEDGQIGLPVQYFEGTDFDRPAGKAIDLGVNHYWPGPPEGDFPPGLHSFDYFSARWEGMITPPEDGEYEIGIEYDDGGRLFFDDELVLEDWGYGPKRYKGVRIYLEKGRPLRVKAEFHQGTADRVFRLVWRTPSERRELVRPRMEPDFAMETYLPKGTDWYDFWTNERFAGGQVVRKECPLEVFPLYVRAGTILPLGSQEVQYATDRPNAPWEIRIYPGANAKFTVYEDNNENYDYERGERATYELEWNDATRTLHIGARHGAFAGMVKVRGLEIVLAEPGKNAGLKKRTIEMKQGVEVHTIRYEGKPIKVTFAS